MTFRFSETQTIQPDAPIQPAATAAGLPHRANEPFALWVDPLRWMFVDGEYLPLVGTQIKSLGLDGIDKAGAEDHMQIMLTKRGRKILDYGCVPPGTRNGQYISRYRTQQSIPARDGQPERVRWFYCTVWETPRFVGTRVLESIIDTKGYLDWLRWLVREGHAPEPQEALVAGCVEVQRRRYESLRQDLGRHPGLATKADEAGERLANMASVAAALGGPIGLTDGT